MGAPKCEVAIDLEKLVAMYMYTTVQGVACLMCQRVQELD